MPRTKEVPTEELEEAASESTKRKKYNRTATGDIVYLHKARGTGATIAVLKGPAELGFGTSSKWVDLCLTHHQFAVFETRVNATAMSTQSQAWCTECASAKKPRKKSAA